MIDKHKLLKILLDEMVEKHGDEKSPFFKVNENFSFDGLYKSGWIYPYLNLQSNIHPMCYRNLTWKELKEELYEDK